jgi:hypothetical protein
VSGDHIIVAIDQQRHVEAKGLRPGLGLAMRFCGASGCCASRFAKQVSGNVEKRESPTLLWEHLEIRLDENLDYFFAVMNLDTNRRVAKVDLVASSAISSNYSVGHHWIALRGRRR